MTGKAGPRLDAHYHRVWGTAGTACAFSEGPTYQLPADFRVLRLPPHGGRTVWTYATRGMSQPGEARPIELHMFAPRETTEVVELLFATAHFHRTEAPLDVRHSVHFGKPWLGRSACHYGLVSLPYLDGPELEIFQAGAATVH
jgi:hypothetical protein